MNDCVVLVLKRLRLRGSKRSLFVVLNSDCIIYA